MSPLTKSWSMNKACLCRPEWIYRFHMCKSISSIPIEYEYKRELDCHTQLRNLLWAPYMLRKLLHFQTISLKAHHVKTSVSRASVDNRENSTFYRPRLPLRLSKYVELRLLGLVGVCTALPICTGGMPIRSSPIRFSSACSAIRISDPGSRLSSSTPNG